MSALEINFDGLVGPTHNYAGLSTGNLASQGKAGAVANPRQAALQGLGKARRMLELGLPQGFLPPPLRPSIDTLRRAGRDGPDAEILIGTAEQDPALFRAACSSSSMWRANAATVIAAPDSRDGRVHLHVANLATMMHRAIEADETFLLLQKVFRDPEFFSVSPALPWGAHFADEGAANHMRLAASHGAPGLNMFVHGADQSGRFPVRQTRRASEALCSFCAPGQGILVEQSPEAIDAGAFHNDVVAVANLDVLLAHAKAFSNPQDLRERIATAAPGTRIIEITDLSLADAVSSYLFNSQLVSLPTGGMALILPMETSENAQARKAVAKAVSKAGDIERIEYVDVRESMRNGGGPACLRLRVPMSRAALATLHPGYVLSLERIERLERLVETHWPISVAPQDLLDPALWDQARSANLALQAFIDGAA